MIGQYEEAAIQSDAYIDALLERPLGPVVAREPAPPSDARLARAIELLAALPRFHPSFAFEEALAARLRDLAASPTGWRADIVRLPVPALPATLETKDRRLLVGGALVGGAALASGFSVAAVLAWQSARRGRPRPGVPA